MLLHYDIHKNRHDDEYMTIQRKIRILGTLK